MVYIKKFEDSWQDFSFVDGQEGDADGIADFVQTNTRPSVSAVTSRTEHCSRHIMPYIRPYRSRPVRRAVPDVLPRAMQSLAAQNTHRLCTRIVSNQMIDMGDRITGAKLTILFSDFI